MIALPQEKINKKGKKKRVNLLGGICFEKYDNPLISSPDRNLGWFEGQQGMDAPGFPQARKV